jgi:hypothetical protein
MNITKTQDRLFDLTIFFSYVLYFIIYAGLISKAPEYLYVLQTFVKLYVSLYLIFKFNFLTNYPFNQLDKKIAFNAGFFLLTTIIFGDSYYVVNKITSK